jgi:dihydrofolate reductase
VSLIFDISVSLDGYVAGPDQSLDDPLGKGGEQLHEWGVATRAFQELHGREGGEESGDSDIFRDWADRSGAVIMGRRMFSGGSGPWEADPNANGWWGDEPPFHRPVFVLTHHEREPLELTGTTFTFVTDGIESAADQARAAAGDKDVVIGGGGSAIQQYLAAGLVDEFQIHLVPVLLGPGGTRLFEDVGPGPVECARIVESPTGVAHLKYRMVR